MEPDIKKFERPEAEEMRVRYLYRNAVLRGRVKLPPSALRSLVGPDCAYHLYKYAQKGRTHDQT